MLKNMSVREKAVRFYMAHMIINLLTAIWNMDIRVFFVEFEVKFSAVYVDTPIDEPCFSENTSLLGWGYGGRRQLSIRASLRFHPRAQGEGPMLLLWTTPVLCFALETEGGTRFDPVNHWGISQRSQNSIDKQQKNAPSHHLNKKVGASSPFGPGGSLKRRHLPFLRFERSHECLR